MPSVRQLALLFALSLGLAQEVVDRMVAVVNKQVILESELDQARRVELLVDGKPFPSEAPEPQEMRALLDRTLALSPDSAFTETVVLPRGVAPPELTLEVYAGERPPIPEPAAAAPPPRDVASADELFLHGLHLEQYRHATYAPEAYYAEALRRDPGDSRCNNALGLLLYLGVCYWVTI